jgi:hypothetical protein
VLERAPQVLERATTGAGVCPTGAGRAPQVLERGPTGAGRGL